MSRLLPHPLLALGLTIAWCLLLDSFAPGVVALGAMLSIAITAWAHAFETDRPRLRRPVLLLRFILLVLWDIVVANISVARLVLSPLHRLHPKFIEVPLEVRDPYAIVALTSVVTLTPGTVSTQLSADRRILYVHVLNAPDPQETVRTIKQRYEATLKEIFE